MQQGVANEGSTAVRSSSLLLSARHNVAIAIQLAQGLRQGDVDRNVEKRALDIHFLQVRRPKERMSFQREAFAKGEAQQ